MLLEFLKKCRAVGRRAIAWLVSNRRKVINNQANLDPASRVVLAQALPSMNQGPQEAVGTSKQRLNSESAWELGRLELVADHHPIETEHQVVGNTRVAVCDADPEQLVALERSINGSARPLVLANVSTECSTFAFRRRSCRSYRG